MAYKRLKIGAVLKSKDTTQPDYIKIDQDITLKKGDILIKVKQITQRISDFCYTYLFFFSRLFLCYRMSRLY